MQKLLYHPIIILIVILVATGFVLSLRSTREKTEKGGQVVERSQQELEALQEKAQALEQQLEEAESPFNQEQVLRDELLLQKEDELVIQIPSIAPQISPSPTPTPTLTPWQQWRAVFKL